MPNGIVAWVALIAALISIIATVVSLLYFIFVVGKKFGEILITIQNIIEDIKQLTTDNKEIAKEIKDISANQIGDIRERLGKVESKAESSHYRLDGHECRINNLENKN